MSVYYNEIDPDCCGVLNELMKDGLIARGEIDNRSIELVQPSDIRGFTQVHLFAGFGIWSAAARYAGWRDDRPVLTASCPCPPFSSAGKVKACPGCGGVKPIPDVRRTGFFLCSLCGHSWLADQRHLWPEVWRLVRDIRPACIMGEQVASADGRTWLDLVRASLEILAYDAWGVDTCAAGFGAPHIRSRLYWVADTEDANGRSGERGSQEGIGEDGVGRRRLTSSGASLRMAHADRAITQQPTRQRAKPGEAEGRGALNQSDGRRAAGQFFSDSLCDYTTNPSIYNGLADSDRERRGEARSDQWPAGNDGTCGNSPDHRPGPVNGFWRDADWLGCTDGKWRPVEPGTFPLAPTRTFRNRVVELRGAGNAVNLAQAAEFIRAVMPELP